MNAVEISSYAKRRPSGENVPANARGSDIGSSTPPSAATVHSWRYADCGMLARSEAKTTRLPSRVHPRTRSSPGCLVSRRGSPPAVGTTETSVLLDSLRLNAYVLPLGERVGPGLLLGV